MKPKVKELIRAIEKSNGNLSAVARMFNRPRSTVQSWVDTMPGALQALEDAREQRVDVAETMIYKAVTEQNLSAAFYVLNNDPKARARGWGHRLDVTSGDKEIQPALIITKEQWDAL